MGSPVPDVSERSLTPDLSFILVGPRRSELTEPHATQQISRCRSASCNQTQAAPVHVTVRRASCSAINSIKSRRPTFLLPIYHVSEFRDDGGNRVGCQSSYSLPFVCIGLYPVRDLEPQ